MIIKRLNVYTPEIDQKVRELLKQLSRSGRDKGEIPKSWFEHIIASPWHDLLLAEDDDEIIGMASVSVIMGAGIMKNAYLEDFVVNTNIRAKGVGTALWNEVVKWAKEKNCKKLEFTCGEGREVAQEFYKKRGAKIYPTNFFRFEL